MGPIEYLVVGFEGNHFTGEIVPELTALKDSGLIRIIDAVVVGRDDAGNIFSTEITDLPDAQAHVYKMEPDLAQWFSQDDIENIADAIPAESTVGLLLVEHLWAQPLSDAIRRANGKLLAQTYVPGEIVDEVRELLQISRDSDDTSESEEQVRRVA